MVSVILVDDELESSEKLAEILEVSGIKVLDIGTDGKQAVEIYQKSLPDIVLCDMQMPNYDGLYAVQNIRKFDPEAKIIMITADLSEQSEQAFLENEVDAVIYKPFDIKKIISVVKGVAKGTFSLEDQLVYTN